MISLKVVWNQGMTLEIRAPYLLCIRSFIPGVNSRLCSTPQEQDFPSEISLKEQGSLCQSSYHVIVSCREALSASAETFQILATLNQFFTQNCKPYYAELCSSVFLHSSAVFPQSSLRLNGAPSYTNREQSLIKTWTPAVYRTITAAVCVSTLICYWASKSGDLHAAVQ